jgi:hypothetical protein
LKPESPKSKALALQSQARPKSGLDKGFSFGLRSAKPKPGLEARALTTAQNSLTHAFSGRNLTAHDSGKMSMSLKFGIPEFLHALSHTSNLNQDIAAINEF